MKHPTFTGRNVPIAEIAKAIGKSPQFIRIGLQQGVLDFGYVIHQSSDKAYSYYCPDKLVWEKTGYFSGNTEFKEDEINETS